MKLLFWRHEPTPSPEAIQARKRAGEASALAEELYAERRRILTENHFAERIRLIYEGR